MAGNTPRDDLQKNLVRKKSYACTSIEDLFGVNYILMHG